jgi:hypothetical protein
MRIALALGIFIGCCAGLDSLPAQAAIAPLAAPVVTATPGEQPDVQPVWWQWHGRRWWHRRWAVRHFAGGVWVPGHWVYW